MLDLVLTPILHLLIVGVVVYLGSKKYKLPDLKVLLVGSLLYLGFHITTFLPKVFPAIQIESWAPWNWSGKLLSILFLVLVILVSKHRKYFFLDWKPRYDAVALFSVLLVFLAFHSWQLFLVDWSDLDWNTMIFQLTMPSISEEVFYRGILLGLFCQFIPPSKAAIRFNVVAVSLLFGLGHALSLDGFAILFDLPALIQTFCYGCFWAWLTIRTKSIYYALLSHTLSNVFLAFVL